ncbi:MAG: hypothetical protein ABIK15_08485 [Pseudomonadota bacterium]
MKWTIQFLHARSALLKPFIVPIGVLVENSLFFIILAVFHRNQPASGFLIGTLPKQLLWAAVTGLFFLIAIDYSQVWFSNWFEEWDFQRREGKS